MGSGHDLLAGKAALVTGAAQGVGQGIALALAAEGASVAIADINEPGLADTGALLRDRGATASTHPCDVGRVEDIQRTVHDAVAAHGTIDILVNCAQSFCPGTLLGVDDEAFDRAWRTGPRGTQRMMNACHPHLRGGGVIVNVGTGAAFRPDPVGHGPYAAIKEAIRALTRAAAVEWGPDGIRAFAIVPFAESPSMASWRRGTPESFDSFLGTVPLGRIGDCEMDIGRAVALLVSDGAGFITGTTVPIDGGQAFLR
jgi:NAD(P)-dependent dehydrogenase (short-subunit alcohol dehydrogenase family)